MKLPALYFRLRENGAAVFRVDAENRHGRLDLEPLAIANVRNGDIRVQGDRELTDAERDEIESWISQRQAVLAKRDTEVVDQALEAMNGAAHWIQGKASNEEVEANASALLLAIHDLRSQIVRRQADALTKSKKD